ncbi:MAG: hypothetical protein H0U71_00615 [Gammaproteobacteria bacterium]|nr:hypothetical protein [Gammaproteobacteria bacterium]
MPDEFFLAAFDTGSDLSDSFYDHESKFCGIGPRVGVNVFYQVANNFGLVTEVAGNLLFGKSDSDYSERIRDVEDGGAGTVDIFEGTHNTHQDDHCNVVPVLSGKVGLAYHATLRNCSTLGIEIGCRGDKYFGIADHSSLVIPDSFTAGFIKDGTYHDFDISGPYLNVSFHV